MPEVVADACFFDPNCGEFYFPDKKNFYEWVEVVCQNSCQGFPCRFNFRWSVEQWALATPPANSDA